MNPPTPPTLSSSSTANQKDKLKITQTNDIPTPTKMPKKSYAEVAGTQRDTGETNNNKNKEIVIDLTK